MKPDQTKVVMAETALETLMSFVGDDVTVLTAPERLDDASEYDTQMSVSGILQNHPTKRLKFRIVVTDTTYTYFDASDVFCVMDGGKEEKTVIVIVVKTPSREAMDSTFSSIMRETQEGER